MCACEYGLMGSGPRGGYFWIVAWQACVHKYVFLPAHTTNVQVHVSPFLQLISNNVTVWYYLQLSHTDSQAANN